MKLNRWGNSMGIRLPTNIVETANLKAGDEMSVRVLDRGDILLTAIKKRLGAAVSVEGDAAANRPGTNTKERW